MGAGPFRTSGVPWRHRRRQASPRPLSGRRRALRCAFHPCCSEQLPHVETRLQEVGAKLAPSGSAVQALRDAREYILANKVRAACPLEAFQSGWPSQQSKRRNGSAGRQADLLPCCGPPGPLAAPCCRALWCFHGGRPAHPPTPAGLQPSFGRPRPTCCMPSHRWPPALPPTTPNPPPAAPAASAVRGGGHAGHGHW